MLDKQGYRDLNTPLKVDLCPKASKYMAFCFDEYQYYDGLVIVLFTAQIIEDIWN